VKPCKPGIEPGSAQPTLEPLEQCVVELVAPGLSNRQVAERLGIPVEQTQGHLFAIMDKLGVSSRLEAVIVAIRGGCRERPSD
jgi:LuxR family maltose regulon positive regulatory protein